ncbi:MAG: hypothetical protein IPN26_09085 [Bacteroidetes bacterium]|nr:hypothetical protein [Bacteroidota bacterium]
MNAGIAFAIPPGTVTGINGSLALPSLNTGIHTLNLRVKNNFGQWSHTEKRILFVKPFDQSTEIVSAEYFVDNDPGLGNADTILIPLPDDTIQHCGILSLPALANGVHQFCPNQRQSRCVVLVRTKNILNSA